MSSARDTRTISVTLYNGEVYEGRYIYGDKNMDISIIKLIKTTARP